MRAVLDNVQGVIFTNQREGSNNITEFAKVLFQCLVMIKREKLRKISFPSKPQACRLWPAQAIE
jgi:hypothetical protein